MSYQIYIDILKRETNQHAPCMTAEEHVALRDMINRKDRVGADYKRVPYGPAQAALKEGSNAQVV